MSKRPNEESREDRWLRKIKMYEEKLIAKRQKRAVREKSAQVNPADQQDISPMERNVQTEGHPENNGDVSATAEPENLAPANSEAITSDLPQEQDYDFEQYAGHDVDLDEISVMTETTTGCRSPNSSCADMNSENAAADICVEEFDPELLRQLGEVEAEPEEFGDEIQKDLAAKFQKILQDGLKKEMREEILKKYLFPKNVPLAKSPTLNPEIGAMLTDNCRQKDKKVLAQQNQVGKTLSALGKAMTGLLKKTPDIPEVIRTLNDAAMLLADTHFADTYTRRAGILPLIDKSLTDSFKDRKRDSFLFGDKLSDLVKDSRGIKKTSQLIQPPKSANTNLNSRSQAFRGARQNRGGQTFQYRATGPRAPMMAQPPYTYSNRRRPAAQLPPPAPRRPLGPPPPPPPARRPFPPAQRPTTRRA
ncbi:hypothetical protein O0L34_g5718 [Tuta absoluta]|nr:hypothetical protein O0L34_g5718 [Tuta absoluta]